MGETINLDMKKREVVRGLGKDSLITVTGTSADDVYVNAIAEKRTVTLYKNDSVAEERLATVRLHLFRYNPGDQPFSATVDISDAPAAPGKLLNAAFALEGRAPPKSKKGKSKRRK